MIMIVKEYESSRVAIAAEPSFSVYCTDTFRNRRGLLVIPELQWAAMTSKDIGVLLSTLVPDAAEYLWSQRAFQHRVTSPFLPITPDGEEAPMVKVVLQRQARLAGGLAESMYVVYIHVTNDHSLAPFRLITPRTCALLPQKPQESPKILDDTTSILIGAGE